MKILKHRFYIHIKEILLSFIVIFSASLFSDTGGISIEEIQELEKLKQGQSIIKEDERFLEIQTSVKREKEDDELECEDCVYGYELFSDIPTTFALSSNVPVPQDYVLGPGDKLILELFGNTEEKIEGFIKRTGVFNIPLLGPLNLAGVTFNQAEELIERKVKSELIGTEAFLSLGELRSITVYVVGAAYKPGTYTLSSLATLTNVIFATGGPSEVGSLRNIQVKRNGKLLQSFDFYDLILNGDTSKDLRLQEGDTVFYPLIDSTVRIDGAVQRPGLYEILEEETLESIFKFAGLKSEYRYKIEFSRFQPNLNERDVSILDNIDAAKDISLLSGDSINILSNSKAKVANIELSGEILYPGFYDISAGETILDVVQKAGGYGDFAYPEAAVFTRESVKVLQKESYTKTAENLEKSLVDAVSSGNQIEGETYVAISNFIESLREYEPMGRQVVSVDEYSLRSDPRLNISLQDGDTLFIPRRSASISVVGEVLNSTTLLFKEDNTIEDYISLAGGTTDGADLSKIFIILPNGQALTYQKKLFRNDINNRIIPGSTIVVSRNPDPFNWLRLTSIITPILSDLAVSAAAIAAISENNN